MATIRMRLKSTSHDRPAPASTIVRNNPNTIATTMPTTVSAVRSG
jgi:hypothetical protein